VQKLIPSSDANMFVRNIIKETSGMLILCGTYMDETMID